MGLNDAMQELFSNKIFSNSSLSNSCFWFSFYREDKIFVIRKASKRLLSNSSYWFNNIWGQSLSVF